MRRLYLFFSLMGTLCAAAHLSYGQSAACPDVNIVGAPLIDLGCTSTCTDVVATMPDIRQTIDGPNAYLVSSIPYSGNYGFSSSGSTPVLVNIDDQFSGVINLGFPFCFYGNTYTQVVVGANGKISFDLSNANNYDVWQITAGIPSSNYERNTIFALFHDIDPSISSTNKGIEWKIEGQAPCRKLIVTWRNIRLYNNSNCPGSGTTSTFQVVLYENTNVIEMYVQKRSLCTNWNNGKGIIGVQNNARNQAVTAPSRNNSTWSTNDPPGEAWRFVPNGPSLLQGPVQLLDENMNVIATAPNPPSAAGVLTATFPGVCIPNGTNSRKLYVRANYIPCSGNSLTAIDSVVLTGIETDTPIVVSPVNYCINEPAVPLQATPTGTGSLRWYTTPAGGTGSTTPITPSTSTAGTFTYYVSQKRDSCESNRIPISVIVQDYLHKTIDTALCPGETFTFKNVAYPVPIVLKDTVYVQGSCDSIITINVLQKDTIVPVFSPLDPLCQGAQASLPPHSNNGIYGTWSPVLNTNSPGVTTHTFTPTPGQACAVAGSITVQVLQQPDTTYVTAAICAGDFYYFNGQYHTASTITSQRYATANNCDSIVTLILTVAPEARYDYDTIYSCKPVLFNGQQYSTTSFVNQTFTTTQGCDSVYRETAIFITNLTYVSDTARAAICQGETFTFRGHTLNQSGVYTYVEQNAQDCDSTFILKLDVEPRPQVSIRILEETGDLCVGKEVILEGKGAANYTWYHNDQIVGESNLLRYALKNRYDKFHLKGSSNADCHDFASIELYAETCCDVFLPNAFSPNGDGVNDAFGSIPESFPTEYHLQIFNRYGQKVFQAFKPQDHWDGTFNGEPCDQGTYFYLLNVKCENSKETMLKGDLLLIR